MGPMSTNKQVLDLPSIHELGITLLLTLKIRLWKIDQAIDVVTTTHDHSPFWKSKLRRCMISQDCHEIYLIIATYDNDYVAYLQGKLEARSHGPFLLMHQIRPFTPTALLQSSPWSA
ncbi:hypothetical protein ACJ73_04327 [Blastomyces percursus]|uniref:Uncharacterized protein n=1 Tax=Blastomyces percursus TaxID=1658174 RepID=A0A1J9Q8B0_9EURO|nr:hypothetical protein ACJ73_04327 [Blastomyces percursus]